MNLASFFSGGKDSTYSVFVAKNLGHTVKCLLTILPTSDESPLLHHPNIRWTKLQSESMRIPQIISNVGSSDDTMNNNTMEDNTMEDVLVCAKNDYNIEGIIHGGISSIYQKKRFESLCKKCGLEVFSPLWGMLPHDYMNKLLDDNFEYVITSVSSGGLDDSWLGKTITKNDVKILSGRSIRHGFNMNFEGGEAETFVTNCPLFSRPIQISDAKRFWDGYRGRFEIIDAGLISNA